MDKGKWRLGTALLFAFVGSWFALYWARGVVLWYQAKPIVEEYPELAVKPVAVPDARLVPLTGYRIEQFGCSFQVPWQEVMNDHPWKSVDAVSFKGGAEVMFTNPAQARDTRGMVQMVREDLDMPGVHTPYDLMAAELNFTPDENRWWKSKKDHGRGFVLLNLKSFEQGHATAIYRLDLGSLHGFQIGDPAVAPYRVMLRLFDSGDRSYEVEVASQDKNRAVITQQELNALVASFRVDRVAAGGRL